MGTLYVVATPIGNLEDLTERAKKTLAAVDFVVCEDTRRSRILLEHAGIHKPLVSLPAFAEGQRSSEIIARLSGGQSAAMVSDAGTPAVSDPGELLVRRALESGISVVPVPGPSSVLAALSASGLRVGRFHFLGFLPRKRVDRDEMLAEVAALSAALVIFEAPQRLPATLADLYKALGNRRACVARELTKVHEEFLRGTLSVLADEARRRELKGEIVIIVEGLHEGQRWPLSEVEEAVRDGVGRGFSVRDLARDLARESHWPAKEIYRLALNARMRE